MRPYVASKVLSLGERAVTVRTLLAVPRAPVLRINSSWHVRQVCSRLRRGSFGWGRTEQASGSGTNTHAYIPSSLMVLLMAFERLFANTVLSNYSPFG